MRVLAFFPFAWFVIVLVIGINSSGSWAPLIFIFPFGIIALLWSFENLSDALAARKEEDRT